MNLVPEQFQKPIKFHPIEEQISSPLCTPNVHVDSEGRFFHGVLGEPHCEELKFHPLCCYIKSKIYSGYSTIQIKENLRDLTAKSLIYKNANKKLHVTEERLQNILLIELNKWKRLILTKQSASEFIIGKMNQIQCPIWDHISSKMNS